MEREHVIKRIEEIRRNGIPKGRNSRKFLSEFDGKYYPPKKYVISLVNKYANDEILESKDFVKAKFFPNNDFFILNSGLIVEFDESQYFTLPRKITLEESPGDLKLGFSREKWMRK